MNEDDTFRILKRIPYQDVNRIYNKWLVDTTTFDKNLTPTYVRFPIEDYGWTMDELYAEFNKTSNSKLVNTSK